MLAKRHTHAPRVHTLVRMTAAATTVSAKMKDAKNSDRTTKNVFAEDASKAEPHAITASMAMADRPHL